MGILVGALAALAGLSGATTTQAGPVSVFPSPGTPTALRGTEISLRGVAPGEIGTVLVTGSRSGRHEGTLAPHPDGRGASFVPHRRFRPGERVTVRTRLDVRGGSDGDFRFTIARGDFEVGTMNAERRLPRLTRGSYHSYRSAPRVKAPRLRVTRRRSGRAPGYLVLNTGWDDDRPRPDGALIADDRGRPVWFLSRRPGRKLFDVAVQRYRGAAGDHLLGGALRRGLGPRVVRGPRPLVPPGRAHPRRRRQPRRHPRHAPHGRGDGDRPLLQPRPPQRAGARQRHPGDRRRDRAVAVRVAQRRQRRPARELRPAAGRRAVRLLPRQRGRGRARRRPADLGAQHVRAVRDRPRARGRSTGVSAASGATSGSARASASAASTTPAGPRTA